MEGSASLRGHMEGSASLKETRGWGGASLSEMHRTRCIFNE